MEETFGEWKQLADQAIGAAVLSGKRVMRIEIDPDELAAWLDAEGLKSYNETRARFCHYVASRKLSAH